MTRITIGPFNRVEGDLEVRLDVESGRVMRAEVTAPLYRGFEQILSVAARCAGAGTADPRHLFGLVIGRGCGRPARRHVDRGGAQRVARHQLPPAAENAADHLTRFYIFFMPDFAREAYAARGWHEEARERFAATRGSAVPCRRGRGCSRPWDHCRKMAHSLAFQPGGTTRAIDLGERILLLSITTAFRSFLERIVFADSLENVLAIATADELDGWRDGRGDFAHFLRLADSLALTGLGRGTGPMMSYGAYHGADSELFPRGPFSQRAIVEPLPLTQITEDVSPA
ncbi:hypothetical protein ABIB80_007119 [Bradyrhizobium sp. i1.15.2]